MGVDFIIVILYITAVVAMGLIFRTKASDVKDFAISAKTYGVFALTATICASFIGGGFASGGAAKAASGGIGSIVTMFGFSAGMLLMGVFLIPNMKIPKGAASAGEIMEHAYGKGARIITGILSMAVCSGILGAQIGAMGYIFNTFFGIKSAAGIIIGCAAVITYSTVGGMSAIVITDTLQFCVLSVCIPLLLFLSVKSIGGFGAVPKEHLNVFNSLTPAELISTALTLALGEILVPPCVQRLLMGNSSDTTRKAVIISSVISVPFFIITGLIGMAGATMFAGAKTDPNSILPAIIIKAAPAGLKGVIIAGMLSIVFSSADSFLNSASVGLVADVIAPLKKKRFKKAQSLRLVMLVNAATGAVAVLVALAIPNLLDILIFSYSFWSPIMLVPLCAALTGIKVCNKAFYTSAVCACAFMAFSLIFPPTRQVSPTILGTIGSLIGFLCFKDA